MTGLNLNVAQTIFFWGFVCMVLGIVLSLLLLTWALIKTNSSITPRQVGKWLIWFAIGLCFCYFMIVVTGL